MKGADCDYSLLLIPAGFFVLMVAGLFAEEILLVITKSHVLSYTIIFWYVFDIIYLKPNPSSINYGLFALGAVGSAVVLVSSLFKDGVRVFFQPVFYAWYLIVVVFAGVSQFTADETDFFDPNIPAAMLPHPLEVFFAGMALTFLVINISHIGFLVRSLGKISVNKFVNIPAEPNSVKTILGIQLALSCLNYWLNLVSHFLFVNFCILRSLPWRIAFLISLRRT